MLRIVCAIGCCFLPRRRWLRTAPRFTPSIAASVTTAAWYGPEPPHAERDDAGANRGLARKRPDARPGQRALTRRAARHRRVSVRQASGFHGSGEYRAALHECAARVFSHAAQRVERMESDAGQRSVSIPGRWACRRPMTETEAEMGVWICRRHVRRRSAHRSRWTRLCRQRIRPHLRAEPERGLRVLDVRCRHAGADGRGGDTRRRVRPVGVLRRRGGEPSTASTPQPARCGGGKRRTTIQWRA